MKVMCATSHMAYDLVRGFPDISAIETPDNVPDDLDLLILTGGSDINPKMYSQSPNGAVGWNDERDTAEFEILKRAVLMSSHLKVLGICRGMQLINVALGGTLVQDIPTPHSYVHRLVHITNSRFKFLESVNSLHHQALYTGDNGIGTYSNPATIIAEHPDGSPEIVLWDDKFLGVQFHPEMFEFDLYNEFFDIVKSWICVKTLNSWWS